MASSSSKAVLLPTHTPGLFAEAVRRAAEALRAGEVVALPTETVYGLAADATNAGAVKHIFEVKGRPANNPIIVHVATLAMARDCVSVWPEEAEGLARGFWPGPLTMVLPRAATIPEIVSAGGPTVGIRWPSHPFIQAVIRECGFPLAAPSANLSNRISATSAEHVARELGHAIGLIVDGGQCQVGIESTVLDLTARPARVLRPGMIHDEALLAVLGEIALAPVPGASQGEFKSPGMLPRHYSPKAKLVCWAWTDDRSLREMAAATGVSAAKVHLVAHTRIPSLQGFGRVSVVPHDPEAFARALYAELHECDRLGAALIAVEAVPETPPWLGIADRLRRASA